MHLVCEHFIILRDDVVRSLYFTEQQKRRKKKRSVFKMKVDVKEGSKVGILVVIQRSVVDYSW